MEKYGPLQPLVSICAPQRGGGWGGGGGSTSRLQRRTDSFWSAVFSQPQTPNLEDDINEVIMRDSGIDLIGARSTPPEQRRKTMVTGSTSDASV